MYRTILYLFLLSSFIYSQERYVEINGQKWRIKTMGQGDVTVLFENGMSDSLETWRSIPDSIARFAKVFLYDRADIGKSDTARLKRTIPNMVQELRMILKHENIKPPYVLVGHSMGGVIDRYFTSEYPDEVVGLLLVEPSPEYMWDTMSEADLKEWLEGGNKWYEEKFPERYRDEWYEFLPNLKYMKELKIPKDLPVILLSITDYDLNIYEKKIIENLPNAKQIILEGSHHIHQDQPDSTIKYIKELLNKE